MLSHQRSHERLFYVSSFQRIIRKLFSVYCYSHQGIDIDYVNLTNNTLHDLEHRWVKVHLMQNANNISDEPNHKLYILKSLNP